MFDGYSASISSHAARAPYMTRFLNSSAPAWVVRSRSPKLTARAIERTSTGEPANRAGPPATWWRTTLGATTVKDSVVVAGWLGAADGVWANAGAPGISKPLTSAPATAIAPGLRREPRIIVPLPHSAANSVIGYRWPV